METTSKSEIVIFQTPDGNTTVNVRLENDTVWLSQDQLSVLFERDKSVISRHINNIFSEGELDRNTTVAKNAIVVQRGFRGEIADEIHLRSIMHMYSVICLITNVAETFLEKCSMIYCLIADESKILRQEDMVGFRPYPDKYMNREGVTNQLWLPHIGDVSRDKYWKIIHSTKWHKEAQVWPIE